MVESRRVGINRVVVGSSRYPSGLEPILFDLQNQGLSDTGKGWKWPIASGFASKIGVFPHFGRPQMRSPTAR